LLVVEGEEELAAAQSSLPAVACRIIVSCPILFAAFPVRKAPETLLICLMCLPAPDGCNETRLRPYARSSGRVFCPAVHDHRLSLDLSLEPGLPGLWSNERCQLKSDGPQQV